MSVEIGDGPSPRATTRTGAATQERGLGWLMTVLHDVRLLLMALWLGAAVFFSAAVAPAAFAVLRGSSVANANHLAGSIVTRTLSIVNTGGFIISLFLLLTAFLAARDLKRRARHAEIISLTLVAILTGAGQWVIAARMLALRVQMGRPIDDVPLSDAARIAFSSLHGYSVAALSMAIIAGIVALLMIARRRNTGVQ
jgi:hypothetical protein